LKSEKSSRHGREKKAMGGYRNWGNSQSGKSFGFLKTRMEAETKTPRFQSGVREITQGKGKIGVAVP